MRIKVYLNTKDKRIDVNYNRYLQAVIYSAMQGSETADTLHNVGYKIENRPFKLFVYSPIIGKSIYEKETKKIQFLENSIFFVASYNYKVIQSLANFFEQNESIIIGKTIISVTGYELISNDEKEISTTYKTISPIVCYVTENKIVEYFPPESEAFKQSIVNNLAKKYYLCYKENMPDLKITQIKDVKERYVHYKNNFFKGNMLTIQFETITDKIKHIILDTGLGSKNSMGCGMMMEVEETNIHL